MSIQFAWKGKTSLLVPTRAAVPPATGETISWLLLLANCRYAIFVPSGEYEGELRRKPAGAVTTTALFPAASMARMVVPVAPVPLTYAIFVPSGDQVGSNSSVVTSFVICVRAPLWTSSCQMS